MTNVSDTASRIRRVITVLNRRLRASSLGSLSPAQASMLATIEKFQTPSLKELALAEMIQPPSVTRLVRSLEQQGMIAASSDEADRRSTRVQLTAKGKKELSEIRLRKTAYLEQHLSSFSAAELKRLTDLIEILEQLTEAP